MQTWKILQRSWDKKQRGLQNALIYVLFSETRRQDKKAISFKLSLKFSALYNFRSDSRHLCFRISNHVGKSYLLQPEAVGRQAPSPTAGPVYY